MTARQRRLLVFCKYPEPGKVKTRLARTIGNVDAARVARQLLDLTMERLAPLSTQDIHLTLFFDPGERSEDFRNLAGSAWTIVPQPTGNLGARLEEAFADDRSDTIVVGSDCPGITAQVVIDAYGQIADRRMVFGPTVDGGFYLMGARRVAAGFFRNIRWSSEVTLKQLRDRGIESGFEIALLPDLYDVDTESDLRQWMSEQAAADTAAMSDQNMNADNDQQRQ